MSSDGKTDHDLITEIHGDVRYIKNVVGDHETRLRDLKSDSDKSKGVQRAHRNYMAVFMTIGTLAIAFIGWFKK